MNDKVIAELVETVEKELKTTIVTYPSKHLLDRTTLEKEKNMISNGHEHILLVLEEEKMTVAIDIKNSKVSGFAIEGKVPNQHTQLKMKELGENLLDILKLKYTFYNRTW